MTLRYFKEKEFQDAKPSCSLSDMQPSFMRLLDEARHIAGVPFKINSAYRSVAYEKEKGRKGTSSHTLGFAVDIQCLSNSTRCRILYGLISVGFNRIGIGATFIHVDMDPNKLPAVWLY